MKSKSEVIWKAICIGVVAFFICIGIIRVAADLFPKEETSEATTYNYNLSEVEYLYCQDERGYWVGKYIYVGDENYEWYVEQDQIYRNSVDDSFQLADN